MKTRFNRIGRWLLLLAMLLSFTLFGCTQEIESGTPKDTAVAAGTDEVSQDGTGTSETDETDAAQPENSTGTDAAQTENSAGTDTAQSGDASAETSEKLDKDGSYTTVEDVSLYLAEYGELPQNFITKKEAQALGWSGGSLEPYAPGKCIGGDRFGNYEGLLPEDRTYHECDIDTLGAKSRGAKRLVFSDDGLIYYTEDHYESFTLLYGEE